MKKGGSDDKLSEVIYICPVCKHKFKNIDSLITNDVNKYKYYKCPDCSYSGSLEQWMAESMGNMFFKSLSDAKKKENQPDTAERDSKKSDSNNGPVRGAPKKPDISGWKGGTRTDQPKHMPDNKAAGNPSQDEPDDLTSPPSEDIGGLPDDGVPDFPDDAPDFSADEDTPDTNDSDIKKDDRDSGGWVNDNSEKPETGGENNHETSDSENHVETIKVDENGQQAVEGNPFRRAKEKREKEEAEKKVMAKNTAPPVSDDEFAINDNPSRDKGHVSYPVDDDDSKQKVSKNKTGGSTGKKAGKEKEKPVKHNRKTREAFEHDGYTSNDDGFYNDNPPYEPEKKDTSIFEIGIKLIAFIAALFLVTNFLIYYFA